MMKIWNSHMRKKISSIFMIVIFVLLCVGMYGLAEEITEPMYRSTSLYMRHSDDDVSERIDYVDDDGDITYAADKHYATIIRTKIDHSVLEKYYDAHGKPAKQKIGHYAVLYSYNADDHNYRVTYLDENDQPMLTSAGYSIILRTYNNKGLLETEYYYDDKERPVRTYTVCSGCKRLYDDTGKNTTLIYLNSEGDVTKTGQGYAIVHRSFYTEGINSGRVKEEFYFDEYDKPIKLSNGQYGIRKEYDEYGRVSKTTFLGAEGDPIVSVSGYSSSKRTFYEDDSICTETFYDTKDNPIALKEGQYGVLYKKTETVYLDINGNPQFNLKNVLLGNHIMAIIGCLGLSILSTFGSKRISVLFLLVYLGFIAYFTLLYRNNTGMKVNLVPLWSYKLLFTDDSIRWQIINNIILFIPLGTVLFSFLPIKKMIIGIALLSFFIETIQYFTGFGLCELDDVISNSLGGLSGFCLGKLTSELKLRIKSWKHIHIVKRR